MKAKDLIKILQGVDPESDVFIDLGDFNEVRKGLIHSMLVDNECWHLPDIESISITRHGDDHPSTILLMPYDTLDFYTDTVVDEFFKKHNLESYGSE